MKPSRTISDIVDELGVGPAQVRLVLLAGGINWVVGTEMPLYGTLPRSVAEHLDVGPYCRALLLSGAVAGMMFGNCAGLLSDRYFARRKPIFLSYMCGIFFAVASTSCSSYGCVLLCWAASAFGLGFGVPTWSALASEASPSTRRMDVAGFSWMLFSAGSLSVMLVQYVYHPDLNFGAKWREVLLWTQVPCLLLFAAALTIGFVDSAHVLAAQGRHADAQEVLETMRRLNGRPEVCVEYEVSKPGKGVSLREGYLALFSRHRRCVTMVLCLLTFTLNLTSYGTLYAEGVVLPSLELGVPTSLVLVMNPISDLLGNLCGVALSKAVSRRSMMLSYGGLAGIYYVVLIFGLARLAEYKFDILGSTLVLAVAMTFKFVLAIGWLSVYTYTTEAFPTLCRTFATGFIMGCGRLGSICAPLVLEHLHLATECHWSFFSLVVCLVVLNMLLVVLCLPETKGLQLEGFLGELQPLNGK